jgi:hypothetical protein
MLIEVCLKTFTVNGQKLVWSTFYSELPKEGSPLYIILGRRVRNPVQHLLNSLRPSVRTYEIISE